MWAHDLVRGTSTRVAFGYDNYYPVWTPDGTRLTFRSDRFGPHNLFWQPADGSGPAERLTQSDFTQYPASWSPDGKTLAFYETRPDTGRDIWLLTLDEPQPSRQL